MEQEVLELHELLRVTGIRGPLVLVGHSIGGLNIRLYAARYDSNVAGMVLVDPTHESAVLYNLAAGRWVRLREMSKGRPVPEPHLNGAPAVGYDSAQDYTAEEFELLHTLRLASRNPLGGRPLVVIGAGNRERPPGLSDSTWQAMRRERDDQVRDLASLSTNSRFVLDSASTHGIPAENPALVAREILDVADAIVAGRVLRPQHGP
jgi:pimeloyl-ACP methyl ester carboxylesterase